MAKPKEYGSPLGAPEPSGNDAGRPKAKAPDADVVREALKKASPRMPTAAAAPAKAPRQSSQNTPPKRRPPAILDAEIDRQSK
jgi:hypothetical protein